MKAWLAAAAPAAIGACALLFSVGLALPPPAPGHPATVLLLPGRQPDALAMLVAADPEIRLLGIGARGLLLGVQYARADLPERLRGSGIVAIVGAGLIGCHQ